MGGTIKTVLSSCHIQNSKMADPVRGKAKATLDTESLHLNMQPGFDKVTISLHGINRLGKGDTTGNKIGSHIESLMEQREKLLERKNETIKNMMEQGQSTDVIKERMKEIDEQLKTLEKQIAKIQFEEQRKNMGLDEENQKKKSDTVSNNTNENFSNGEGGLSLHSVNTLITADKDLRQIENMNTVKTKVEGRAHVLKKEIELDESRSSNGRAAEAKYEEYDKLQQRLLTLKEDIGKKMFSVNEKISENAEHEDIRDTDDANTDEVKKDTISGNRIQKDA